MSEKCEKCALHQACLLAELHRQIPWILIAPVIRVDGFSSIDEEWINRPITVDIEGRYITIGEIIRNCCLKASLM